MTRGRVLVDMGNSRVKWAREEEGRLTVGPPFPSDSAALVGQLDFHWGTLEAPRAVHAVNVAGAEMAAALARWVSARWGVPVHFARAEAESCGVTNGYRQPETLGVDRWIGLIGLWRHYGLPACLADCGTALTFDVLDAEGRHLGGLIAPGLALMKRALLQETSGIRVVEAETSGFLGRDTAAGVESGVRHACAGLLEKSLVEAAKLLGRTPALVLCGGDGESIGRCLGVPHRVDADLVLRGLLTLADNES